MKFIVALMGLFLLGLTKGRYIPCPTPGYYCHNDQRCCDHEIYKHTCCPITHVCCDNGNRCCKNDPPSNFISDLSLESSQSSLTTILP